MSFRETYQYLEKKSWAHKASPLVKMFFTFTISLVTVILWDFLSLLLLFVLSFSLFSSLKPPLWKVKGYLKLLASLLLITIFSQSLFFYKYYQGKSVTVLFTILPPRREVWMGLSTGKGLVLTLEGAFYGLKIALKMFTSFLLGLFLILTTRPIEILDSLTKIGFPSSIALMFISALRFVPTLYEEMSSTIKSLKMKGETLSLGNFFRIAKLVISNTIYRSIRRAIVLGLSLELRGFRGEMKRLKHPERNTKANVLIGIFIAGVVFFFLSPFSHC